MGIRTRCVLRGTTKALPRTKETWDPIFLDAKLWFENNGFSVALHQPYNYNITADHESLLVSEIASLVLEPPCGMAVVKIMAWWKQLSFPQSLTNHLLAMESGAVSYWCYEDDPAIVYDHQVQHDHLKRLDEMQRFLRLVEELDAVADRNRSITRLVQAMRTVPPDRGHINRMIAEAHQATWRNK